MRIQLTGLIIALTAIFAGISFAVVLKSNAEISEALKQRETTNALERVLEFVGEEHPVLNEELKGEILVVNLWAGWCKPCLREIPELNELANEFSSQNIRFLAFSPMDEKSDLLALEKVGLFFDYELFHLSPREVNAWNQFLLKHERAGYPTNIIVNEKGRIAFYEVGYSEDNIQKMRALLELLTGD
ncbi:TlpA family protein disulfide reductase [Luteibaculum oceani]|uniref:Redoxin domain-containing protein n=1 Tax=Luteibaculum oceani TaxID=1294296 RepID=A0A5C6URX8_9FLAO|nr:TlpA family protein disulfide reductase [Luteibaculum oceani]TXC76062.1 redoxin domain-containing protein [Luteibaculum oceani]